VNGEVAQLVSLVAFGNRLRADGGDPPELFPGHSTFRWVGDVRFAGVEGTAPWFEAFPGRLVLYLPAARPELAVFANATQGAIWDGAAVWRARWEVRDRDAPEQGIWAVEYTSTPEPSAPPEPPPDAATELDGSLAAAESLAARHLFLGSFTTWFEQARAALADPDPVIEYLPDLVPPGWDLHARRLLTAAAHAWVFGGMGSWNDVTFPDDQAMKREHEEVTGRLYRAVCAAIVAGANA
jgi:hypothetical protein